jgi:hypothetical protein
MVYFSCEKVQAKTKTWFNGAHLLAFIRLYTEVIMWRIEAGEEKR